MVTIRELAHDDLKEVTKIHTLAFPDSAMTKLGDEVVRRYYEWQMTGPHDSSCIGAIVDGDLVGFCFGGVFRGALGGFLDKNRTYLMWRVISHPWLLFNTLFRDRLQIGIQRAFRRFIPKKQDGAADTQASTPAPIPSFGILSIAVLPIQQGSGAARHLMEHAEQLAITQGFSRMSLTVHPSNSRAIRFYEKMGWERTENTGSWSGRMYKILADSN